MVFSAFKINPMKLTQNEKIINYLKTGKRLTRLTCFKLFGFMTLNSRAPEIKKAGYPIESQMVTDKNGIRYAEYFFK